MKSKYLLLPLMGLCLVSCGRAPIDVKAIDVKPELLNWLSCYKTNYTRETQMFFTPDAYKELTEIQNGMNFPFTMNRKTLWVENGLYMTTLGELVNAGYYSIKEDGHDQLYRYTLPQDDPATYISCTEVPEGFNSVKQTGITQSVEDFFVEMSQFNNQAWADKFSYDEVNQNFVSQDEGVLNEFLAFTASCYLNPEVGDPAAPYLSFKEARIVKNKNDAGLALKLYVKDEYKDKVSTEDGLFSMASVYDAGVTEIPVLKAYLDSLK